MDHATNLAALNLSIAARSYWVGLQALDLGAHTTDNPIAPQKAESARRELESALAAIEKLTATAGLEWQTIPIDRLLRTQVGRLRDSLYYASPAALGGFGTVDLLAADYLSAWSQAANPMIDVLADAVEGRRGKTTVPGTRAGAGRDTPKLSAHQRPALTGFARAFGSHLLLFRARGQAALPPSHPTLASPYDRVALLEMLEGASSLQAHLHTLTSAFAINVPLGATAAALVQRSMHDALECLGQLARLAGAQNGDWTVSCARLCVLAAQHQTLALNLA